MDSLRDILAARYNAAKDEENEAIRLAKKQKLENRLKEFEMNYSKKFIKNFFLLWNDVFMFPWKKQVKIIIRFLKYVHFWKKSPRSGEIIVPQIFDSDDDSEILLNTRHEYEESLKRDIARESIPLTFWINTKCPPINPEFSLIQYINKDINVSNFLNVFNNWPKRFDLIFWIRVHQNSQFSIPVWTRSTSEYMIELANSKISELASQIISYEKHQCPHCDGMFDLNDLTDFNDYKICIFCNSMQQRHESLSDENQGECSVCNQYAEIRFYDEIPVCEICARRINIYVVSENEKQKCPGCNIKYPVNQMFIHPEGLHFCRNCALLVGINIVVPNNIIRDEPSPFSYEEQNQDLDSDIDSDLE